jgi:hypothetical protein
MSNTNPTRRRFLSVCTSLLLALLGLLVLIPAFRYLWAPLRRKAGAEGAGTAFLDAGPLSDFPVGEWRLRALEVVHEDGWSRSRVRHAIAVGRRTGGPPPRSMDLLPFEVRSGRLWVRWQDFKPGVADRVPVTT